MIFFAILIFVISLFILIAGYFKLAFIERWATKFDVWAEKKKHEYKKEGKAKKSFLHHIKYAFVAVAIWISTMTKKYFSSIHWRSAFFIGLVAFAFFIMTLLIFAAIYAVIYIALMLFSLWLIYKVIQIFESSFGGDETIPRTKTTYPDVDIDEVEEDGVPPFMGPGGKKSRVYKGAMGTTYIEDDQGNRSYKRSGISGEYWEDNKGNKTYKREETLGGEYYEDDKGNKVYKHEEVLGGEYYEDDKGNKVYKHEGVLGGESFEKD